MAGIIIGIIFLVLAAACAVISIMSFKEKGFLVNNAYIWASKKERESLDKKPRYRQTAVAFSLVSACLVFVGLACVLGNAAVIIPAFIFAIVLLFYVIRSSASIEQQTKGGGK